MIEIIETSIGVRFKVKVVPRSSKACIVGVLDGALKVKLTSPPIDGAANAELIKLIAKCFDAARSSVNIVSGETSRTKTIEIEGIDRPTAATILNAFS